jgi:hypothetical protein
MKDKTALTEKIMPLYEEFFRLLHQNVNLELDVKEIAVEQIKVKEAEKVKKLSEKKAELLDVMVKNNFRMDRLKMSLRNLDPGTPFKKSNLFSKLDELGRTTGTHALNIGKDDLETLQKLSHIIAESGFAQPVSDFSRGPLDPCMCTGCTGCKGCTTLCEASCGHCIGCTGCSGCSGCGDVCSSCFGVSASTPKRKDAKES